MKRSVSSARALVRTGILHFEYLKVFITHIFELSYNFGRFTNFDFMNVLELSIPWARMHS